MFHGTPNPHFVPVECLTSERDEECQRGQAHTHEPKTLLSAAIPAGNEHPDHVEQDEAEDHECVVEVEVDDDRPTGRRDQLRGGGVGEVCVGRVDE